MVVPGVVGYWVQGGGDTGTPGTGYWATGSLYWATGSLYWPYSLNTGLIALILAL